MSYRERRTVEALRYRYMKVVPELLPPRFSV